MFCASHAYALSQFTFPYLYFMQIVTPRKQIVLKSSAFWEQGYISQNKN